MKNIMKSFVLMIVLCCAMFAYGNEPADTVTSASGYYEEVSADDMTFSWAVDGDTLYCKISAPTTGWVAVGFNPSDKMKDADIKIGYIDDGEVTLDDHFGNGKVSHLSDEKLGGTSEISDISGVETDDTTEISFSMPLNSGDEYDTIMAEGDTVTVILAYGKKDKLTSYHSSGRQIVVIEL